MHIFCQLSYYMSKKPFPIFMGYIQCNKYSWIPSIFPLFISFLALYPFRLSIYLFSLSSLFFSLSFLCFPAFSFPSFLYIQYTFLAVFLSIQLQFHIMSNPLLSFLYISLFFSLHLSKLFFSFFLCPLTHLFLSLNTFDFKR